MVLMTMLRECLAVNRRLMRSKGLSCVLNPDDACWMLCVMVCIPLRCGDKMAMTWLVLFSPRACRTMFLLWQAGMG